jgi:RNA polymerase sigma factor (sigma-70 family)
LGGGDEAELYEQFNPRLAALVRARVNTSPDVIEDACSFAWEQFMRYQPDRSRGWRTWLLTTAERQAWRLHRERADHLSIDADRDSETPAVRFESADPRSDRSDHAEALEALRVLATLPERRRRAMEMHVAGFTYDEIAAKLGIGRARVNHLIREANAAIQAEHARITGNDVPRSRRAARLSALENDPPAWLVSAIGRFRKRDSEQAKRAWRRAALAIDDYRQTHGAHLREQPLGERPTDPAAARAFDLAARAAARSKETRAHGLER